MVKPIARLPCARKRERTVSNEAHLLLALDDFLNEVDTPKRTQVLPRPPRPTIKTQVNQTQASLDSWADLLRDLRRRDLNAPKVLIGDGALGLWAAATSVWPETVHQRCWFHKAGNVLSALPKSQHPSAKRMLTDIRDAATLADANTAIKCFESEFGTKWPKAAAKIVDDCDELLAFFKFPAEHWVHLKTTNPIESTFATVRLRTRVTKGPGSATAGIAMAFKLLQAAQTRCGNATPHTSYPPSRTVTYSSTENTSQPPKKPPPNNHQSTTIDYCSP